MAPKQITAKFAGKCGRCSGHIAVGDAIMWAKGSKATHVACTPDKFSASAPSAASRTKATTAPGMATARQLATLSRMASRLSRVSQFDSVSGHGAEAAAEIHAAMVPGLTSRQASVLIDNAGFLLDDEM